jgi:hypothetical protein
MKLIGALTILLVVVLFLLLGLAIIKQRIEVQ